MRKRYGFLVAAVTTTLTFAVVTGCAFAGRALQARPAGVITSTAPLNFTAGGRVFTSLVTLRGSIHTAQITKTRGSLIGYITDCRTTLGGSEGIANIIEARCNLTVPWHIQYESFSGTLPRIASLTLTIVRLGIGVRDLVGGALINCLYAGNQSGVAEETGTPGVITQIRLRETPLETTTPEERTCESRQASVGSIRGVLILNAAQTLRLI